MKKKQKKSTTSTSTSAGDATATTTTDLKAIIADHRLFFDKLIDLIPPRFYLPNDDADSKPWYQGLSKAAKASLKQQTIQNLKLARRNRLDFDKKDESTTSLLVKQKTDDAAAAPINLGDLEEENNENPETEAKNVTYEELRQKLHRKIEMLRGNRGGEGMEGSSNRAIRREKAVSLKRKRDEEGEDSGEGKGEAEKGKGKSVSLVEKDIEFGKVKLGDDDENKGKKKRKGSKAKELERLKRLEEVKSENRTVAEKEAWKAALKRATGVKVHDDPSKVKKSMKKEKKRKEKSKEKWKERVESQEKLMKERQQKRRDNIAGKVKEKKNRKIAKREKKLMRPGFEGRKEGYITQDKS